MRAIESCPETWNDERLNKECQSILNSTRYALPPSPADDEGVEDITYWCRSVGKEKDGIRCIVRPCMATQIGHLFDMVCLDEAHYACNLDAQRTQMLIRMQPRYRYAFTATPIPNIVTNLFSLFGWLCVKDWYVGDRRNAAWPYARGEISRFNSTFLTVERDITMERIKRERDKKWNGKCEKISPIIAQPARLLKILRPTMAFISKPACNPNYIAPETIDVRVPFGEQQMKLYAHFLNRANIPAKSALVRARKQIAYLRGICADPAGFMHGGPKVHSNFNPKTATAIQLIQEIIVKGEQVTVISARVGQTNAVVRLLRDLGISFSRIDSTVPAERHSHEANLFKARRTQVCAMGLKCAAAHSFDQCENLIVLSIDYSPGPLNQARGRIDRLTNKVVKKIYCILHKHSIEETQFDCVAQKDDSAMLCLHGKRIPRDFKPVDSQEVLAMSIANFSEDGTVNERDCETKWVQGRRKA